MEASVMVYFDHPNVLSLLAITIDKDKPHVILPFMDLGDLRSYVSKPDNVCTLNFMLDSSQRNWIIFSRPLDGFFLQHF